MQIFLTMKSLLYNQVLILLLSAAFAMTACAENITLTAKFTVNGGSSDSITLNQGDTATLVFSNFTGWANAGYTTINCVTPSLTRSIDIYNNLKVVISGSATLKLVVNTGDGLATFEISRAGIASPPAAIPQEAGTTWNVILESSSDLINWTPANPGNYTGTEPKRFFRTRIVKNP